MSRAAVPAHDLRPVDPIALEARWHALAACLRLRAAPSAAFALALVWAVALAAIAVGAIALGMRIGADAVPRHGMLAALLLFFAAYADHSRAAVAAVRGWRSGWLAALPGTLPWIGRALARRLLLRAALQVLLVALVLAGSLARATDTHGFAALAVPLLLAPLLAAGLAWWRERRHAPGAHALGLAGTQPQRASAPATAVLPPFARWQQVVALQASRGTGGARAFGVLLLLVPFGAALHHTLAAILLMALAGSLLAAWLAALRTLPLASALLRATPWKPSAFLRDSLALPLALLALALLLLVAAMLVLGQPMMAVLLGAGLLGAGSLHATVVAAERLRPRRIPALLGLHAGLQLGILQTLPPLAPVLLLAQLGWLLRRALRA